MGLRLLSKKISAVVFLFSSNFGLVRGLDGCCIKTDFVFNLKLIWQENEKNQLNMLIVNTYSRSPPLSKGYQISPM